MKKFFLPLVMAIPSLYYLFWYVQKQISAYNFCIQYKVANPDLTYYQCVSLSHYFSSLPSILLISIGVFIFIYSIAYSALKIEDKISRNKRLAIAFLLLMLSLGFDLMIWGLDKALM
jgi:hypothetical protein